MRYNGLRLTQRFALEALQQTPTGVVELTLPIEITALAGHGVGCLGDFHIPLAVTAEGEQKPTATGAYIFNSDMVSAHGYALYSVAEVTIPFYVTATGKAAVVGSVAVADVVTATGVASTTVSGVGAFVIDLVFDTAGQADLDGFTYGTAACPIPLTVSGVGIGAVVGQGSAKVTVSAGASGAVGVVGSGAARINPIVIGRGTRGAFSTGVAHIKLSVQANGKHGVSGQGVVGTLLGVFGTGAAPAQFVGVCNLTLQLRVTAYGAQVSQNETTDAIYVSQPKHNSLWARV